MADLRDLANPDYVGRVNRAIDHVLAHLAEPLPLAEVARAADFSPFHFHRIFRALMGQTLHAFVKRVRLERAVALMSHPPRRTLTEVALACGFGSSSEFSRAFREHYGLPPRRFDVAAWRGAQRQQMEEVLAPGGGRRFAKLPPGHNPDGFAVELRSLPARRVAYLRVLRPYEGDAVPAANTRLFAWARERGLERGQWLGWQWDDPEIVPLEQCRYDVGVVVPAGTPAGGEVGTIEFPPMRVAELAIAGPIELEMRALDWLYGTWLPSSGCTPDHQPGFEAWVGAPFAHGFTHFELRLQLPVVRVGTGC